MKPRGLPDRYRLKAMTPSFLSSTLPLTGKSVEQYLSKMNTAGSTNRVLALIVAVHNASGVKPPEVERRPNPPGRTRWLTEQEWHRLRAALELITSERHAKNVSLASLIRDRVVPAEVTTPKQAVA